MAKRTGPLLLDANVVLKLHELGIWPQTVAACDALLSETVVNSEVQFIETEEGRQYIDLGPFIASGAIKLVTTPLADVRAFKSRFKPLYIDKLDPGEAESLAYLVQHNDHCICSADAIVWKALGALRLREQGLSLEELLQRLGLSRPLDTMYSKAFRERLMEQGSRERMQGQAIK
jgi:hypothetical protein